MVKQKEKKIVAKVYSSALFGIEAYPVEVEVDLARGLPKFSIVGLPDLAVKEARERVSSAIKNSAFEFPTKKITVNLAPADIKKEGSSFDLSMTCPCNFPHRSRGKDGRQGPGSQRLGQ